MNPKTPALFLLLLSLTAFTACDSGRVFDQYQKIGNSGWHKDSLVVFTIPVTDSLQNYHLQIQIRHEKNYEYSNLWLFVEITQPGGKMIRDTFELALAEPSGRWLGEGLGGILTLQTNYKRNFWFPVAGEYSISIQQGMRKEVLTGIHDVGVRLEKSKISGKK
ncbi:MAG: gliding motility lipoprotein GldH [Mariniphaga sp.]|nr:gliding motility lipoprotein GldH [Mariniphaga sp.]MDD4225465.1 gliding motility lipoprotein GldH [Mariniphaga sp.]